MAQDAASVMLAERVADFTEIDPVRLAQLGHLAELAPTGAIVECGTARGGSAAMLAAHSAQHLWLYDTFAGLPAPTAIDGEEALDYIGANKASPDDVHAAMRHVGGVHPLRYTIRVGNFRHTFIDDDGPDRVGLLHVDADWYESVLLSLRHWYPRLVSGGFVVLDDFGFWPGCRAAFYEFVHEHELTPDLWRCGDAAWWVKD